MGIGRYPVPDEELSELLRRNGIDPSTVCVTNRSEESVVFKNYKTGDSIRIEENFEKKNRRALGW